MTKFTNPDNQSLINEVIVNNWVSSGAFITFFGATILTFIVWAFRLAIRDQVKKEIEPVTKEISEMKIVSNKEFSDLKIQMARIAENIHAIKNSEAGELGTLSLILDHLQKTESAKK